MFKQAWRGGVGLWALMMVTIAWCADVAPAPRDTLVYKDGDRVQGRLVSEAGGVLVFKADRFGELRVPVAEATVLKAGSPGPVVATAPVAPIPPAVAAAAPPAAPAPAAVAAKPAAQRDDQEHTKVWERFSPAALTARVHQFFGPWHGRFAFSTEVVTDSAQRQNNSYEALMKRKWTADEVQLNARFDFSETSRVATTDLWKVWGQWRHDFGTTFFLQYRPTSEFNRASSLNGVPNDYVLLQQELGGGYQWLNKQHFKARFGISQNRFDTWNSIGTPEHSWRSLQSFFEENEINLPWRMSISQRGVWYPVPEKRDGWENRFDLNKKLTETLSASLRHEIRRNNPDGTSPDYTRLKLMFGLDF